MTAPAPATPPAARHFRGIVLHTVGVRGDSSMAAIRRYHVEHNGWKDAGYHFGVKKDGTIEQGRPLSMLGAHAQGANDTVGLCVYGDGDSEAWTPAQRAAVLMFCGQLCHEHGWDPLKAVAGHREAQRMFGGAPTTKTCPGKLVDMSAVRDGVTAALAAIQAHAASVAGAGCARGA
jgi:N-acetyl-anhydromuramyl-L-alanine amidase AmpD